MNEVLKGKSTNWKAKFCAGWQGIWTRLAADRRLRWEVSLLLGLVLTTVLTAQCSSFAQAAAQVRQDTLRLHVQAASDCPGDQLLKLRVRDAILQEAQVV